MTPSIIICGFSAVLNQNEEIIERNKNLKNQITRLEEQVSVLLSELERLRAEERKDARAKRKRLAKRDPITLSIYEELITSIPSFDFKSARLRIALLILAITGIRVNELLPLKMKQLITLINSNWISINRSKRGPSSHKAYLTALGKKLIEFVRQAIGHSKLESTSLYVENLSDEDRRLRMEQITSPEELIIQKS